MQIRIIALVSLSFLFASAQEVVQWSGAEGAEPSTLSSVPLSPPVAVEEVKSLESSTPVVVSVPASLQTEPSAAVVEEQAEVAVKAPAILGVTQPILVQIVEPEKKKSIDLEKFHTHDGVYLSLRMGYGVNATRLHGIKEEGVARDGSFRLGGAINRNLLLYCEFAKATLFDDERGEELLTLSTGGLGFDYYFMPTNVFVGMVIGNSEVAREDSDEKKIKGRGFVLRSSLGKEWWVSDNWGIGFALSYMHSRTVFQKKWERSNTIALHLSSTFN